MKFNPLFKDSFLKITSKIFLFFSSISRPLTFMGSQTKRVLLTPLMHPARPFRVSNHDRSSRRGVMATSLKELLSKVTGATAPPHCSQEGPRPHTGLWSWVLSQCRDRSVTVMASETPRGEEKNEREHYGFCVP